MEENEQEAVDWLVWFRTYRAERRAEGMSPKEATEATLAESNRLFPLLDVPNN